MLYVVCPMSYVLCHMVSAGFSKTQLGGSQFETCSYSDLFKNDVFDCVYVNVGPGLMSFFKEPTSKALYTYIHTYIYI